MPIPPDVADVFLPLGGVRRQHVLRPSVRTIRTPGGGRPTPSGPNDPRNRSTDKRESRGLSHPQLEPHQLDLAGDQVPDEARPIVGIRGLQNHLQVE